MVTVVIPNYNNARYIEKCITSVLNQSYKDIEVLCVDDCSTDNSREIIERLAKNNSQVHSIFLEKNGGVSNARNVGLQNAHGEFITFMDGDDFYYNPDKIKNEMALIEKYQRKKKDVLAYSTTVNADENSDLIVSSIRGIKKRQFMKGNVLPTLVSMSKQRRVPRDYIIRKSILEAVGGYSFYKDFYEDLDLLMKISEYGIQFYPTYEYGTAYRKTQGGLSKRPQEEHLATIKEIQAIHWKKMSLLQKAECFQRNRIGRMILKIKKIIHH